MYCIKWENTRDFNKETTELKHYKRLAMISYNLQAETNCKLD